jgi:hypothetical protein
MASVLEWKPAVVCGSQLSAAEYEARKKACTAAALARCGGQPTIILLPQQL